jgi:hypothetical protein
MFYIPCHVLHTMPCSTYHAMFYIPCNVLHTMPCSTYQDIHAEFAFLRNIYSLNGYSVSLFLPKLRNSYRSDTVRLFPSAIVGTLFIVLSHTSALRPNYVSMSLLERLCGWFSYMLYAPQLFLLHKVWLGVPPAR